MVERVLIVEKQRSIRNVLREKLEFEGYQVDVAENVTTSLKLQEEQTFDFIISDDLAFEEFVAKHGKVPDNISVIVMAQTRSVDEAVQFVRAGAVDYVAKPLDMNYLLTVIKDIQQDKSKQKSIAPTAVSRVAQRKRPCSGDPMTAIIGSSVAIQHVKNLINKVATSDARVLIMGDNGTGKELVAKALHERSGRCNAPFVEVNCAAIPSELIESELFGHEKGAFTSAIKQRKGKFEQASGGTLFLDEIGDMSGSAQAKVLRVLEESKICRVGGDDDISVDVRILAATNKDLKEEIKKGNFREDLYHRLSVIVIQVPSLINRLDDIPDLVEYFLERLLEESAVEPKTMEQEAIERLKTFEWSGNVRELRNVMERLIILGGDSITVEDVDKYVTQS